MTDDKKPREFWIELNPAYIGPYNSNLKKYDAYNRKMSQREIPQVRVIEYSAYEQAQKRINDLEAENILNLATIAKLSEENAEGLSKA